MKRITDYFIARKGLTFAVTMVFCALALGYGLLCLLAMPHWNFWLVLIPAAPGLIFRLLHGRAREREAEKLR